MGEVREGGAVVGLGAGWALGLGRGGFSGFSQCCCGELRGKVRAGLFKVACHGEVTVSPWRDGGNKEVAELGIERLPNDGVLQG